MARWRRSASLRGEASKATDGRALTFAISALRAQPEPLGDGDQGWLQALHVHPAAAVVAEEEAVVAAAGVAAHVATHVIHVVWIWRHEDGILQPFLGLPLLRHHLAELSPPRSK